MVNPIHESASQFLLAARMAMAGTPLRAGMIVTTGSCCGVVDVPIDTPLSFEYGDVGTLLATLIRVQVTH